MDSGTHALVTELLASISSDNNAHGGLLSRETIRHADELRAHLAKWESVSIVDPPSGWRYGFPQPVEHDYEAQLRKANYPEKDIPFALKNSRYWNEWRLK